MLEACGDLDQLQLVQARAAMANVYSVRQKNPRGLGHAVLCARSFVGDEPFAILLGDDIVVNRNGKTATQQLVDVYHETGDSVVGVQRVAPEVVHKYGIIDPKEQLSERPSQVRRFVEKPSREEAPSNFAILGRYVLTPAIFDLLETQAPGKGNEIQLTDAIDRLSRQEAVYAYDFEGRRYDVGDKKGFLQAQVDFALEREDLHDAMMEIIRSAIQK